MPFPGALSISGWYEPLGRAQDGDTLRFRADRSELWGELAGPPCAVEDGAATVRLDGVDALETHFRPQGSSRRWRQPAAFALRAADELLAWLGFAGVVRDDSETIVSCGPQRVRGFLVAGRVDRFGRAIGFAFRGTIDTQDGQTLELDDDVVGESANHHLLACGLAYPTFHATLEESARASLALAARAARTHGRGFWPADATRRGVALDQSAALEHDIVILPKLFRRIAEFVDRGAVTGGEAFRAFLATGGERVRVASRGEDTTFAQLLEIDGMRVGLAVDADDLVF